MLNGPKPSGNGYFVKPTILAGMDPDNELSSTEIFGPVLDARGGKDLDGAIDLVSRSAYGNAASIFTYERRLSSQIPLSSDLRAMSA